jgi:phosphoglycolate phosphatase
MSTNISKTKVKCAVFDLDGTLLDTLDTITYYLNLTLKNHGLSAVTRDQCKGFVGDGAVKLIQRALSSVGADESLFDSVYSEYNRAYNSDPYYLTVPYEGVIEMLSRLRDGGIILAVLSNKPDFAAKAAIERFLPNIFHCVLGGRDNKPLKPDPTELILLLERLGCSPGESAYIGDSEPDVLTSRNADVGCPIFVSYGFRTESQLRLVGAKTVVSDPSRVSDIILNSF